MSSARRPSARISNLDSAWLSVTGYSSLTQAIVPSKPGGPFDRQFLGYGPYFFPGLADVSEAGEQAAIDAGELEASRITYVGRRRA